RVFFTILGEPDSRYPAELIAIEPAPESIAKESSSTTATTATTAIYYMGILDVPNNDGKLRISMTTQVNIVLSEAKNVLVVPAAALGNKSKEGRYAVRVETAPGKVEEQQVLIGLNNNVQAEILEGLSEGQQVVIGEQMGGATAQSATPKRRSPMPRMF
ncbi:MAG: efflux transporter periplasmic adaptor subunit, partial [Desulfobulbaceae bacterium]|nr:efflux transporter periplasmic adaptor subunit [Desulfobulbaceae bacterium]